MDADDRDLAFAASLLSYAAMRGGLTEKQARHATRLVQRLQDLWRADALACQRTGNAISKVSHSLSDMATKGNA